MVHIINNADARRVAKLAQLLFLDFDGVIKDSVKAKSNAFERLFSPYGADIASKICSHHENNGGMSRYKKMPIYLKWVGRDPTSKLIEEYCKKFSAFAKHSVVSSPWVDGVINYIKDNYKQQPIILVTATPELEIMEIIKILGIVDYFSEVHGSPENKSDVIKSALCRYQVDSKRAVFIGDSDVDLEAANNNDVTFLLRRTKLNYSLQERSSCLAFDDL